MCWCANVKDGHPSLKDNIVSSDGAGFDFLLLFDERMPVHELIAFAACMYIHMHRLNVWSSISQTF
jgi:hypothetical protein